jgi:Skp family chaperone for outer membrane proteins
MSPCLTVRLSAALMTLLLFSAVAAPPPRAAAAEEEIKCANCGKKVKQSKAIKVIKNGQVYYVCSDECAKKLKNKK